LSTIGEMLREVRERRGLTLADAERETKIRQKYLAALEDDNLAALPGPLYVRGFLRNYALYLGIDGDEALEIYNIQRTPTRAKIRAARGEPLPKPGGNKDPEKISIAPLSPEKIDTRVRYGTQYIAISLLAIPLIIVFYFIYSGAFGSRSTGIPVPTGSPAVPTQISSMGNTPIVSITPTLTSPITSTTPLTSTQAAVESNTPLVAVATGTPQSGADPTALPSPVAGKVTVKVEAVKDVWMRVTVDGEKVYENTLAQGLSKQWTGDSTVRIRTGRADVVKLTVNGEDKGLMLGKSTALILEKEWNAEGKETIINK
jgi:cytoskeletal protein RodZ